MGVCRTHYMRNLLTKVPKTAQAMVATLVRTIYVPLQESGSVSGWGKLGGVVR